MKTKFVDIKGEELGLLVNFEVTQTFYHESTDPVNFIYILPNDLKMCIYDITFVVGDEIIKPILKAKEEARRIYSEAIKTGHTAVKSSNLQNGLTQFNLGNVPPNTDCKVIFKIALTANMINQNIFFIKFPLDVYTPRGSIGCLDISSNFHFQLQCDKEKIKNVTSNVLNSHYDNSIKLFTIQDCIKNERNERSIIINFETNENIQNSVIIGETVNGYDTCAITIYPNFAADRNSYYKEYIFLIDCSGSMEGYSITKASECLELFIRSLPAHSYFNIIWFGDRHKKLFAESANYDDSNIKKALNYASHLKADLGGTSLIYPLNDIFRKRNQYGQRQIFIITDGEVDNAPVVINLDLNLIQSIIDVIQLELEEVVMVV